MFLAIITAILVINILVIVHEFGHFLAAKWRGIVVEVFSVGYGPKLIGFKFRGTEYRISAVLFGGYVKFLGDEVEQQDNAKKITGSYYSASAFSRIAACFAGGFFNIVFAYILYTVISLAGKPVPEDSLYTIIGGVKEGSIAQEIGLVAGDKILSIDDKTLTTWETLIYAIAFSKNEITKVVYERDGEIIEKNVKMRVDKDVGARMLGVYPKETIVVNGTLKDSPAEKAGLVKDDTIVAINGERVFRFERLFSIIKENEGKEISLTVSRDGTEIVLKMIPVKLAGKDYAAIGFSPTTKWVKIYPKPWKQFSDDLSKTWETLRGLFTLHIPMKAMSGPVGIIGFLMVSMQGGLIALLSFVALISLNLGVVNLLPIPVLDGGHIMFNIVEAIRKKPLSVRTIANIQNVFTTLLIIFALYVTYHDVLRFFK